MQGDILPNLQGLALVQNDEQNFARSSCILDTSIGLHDSNGDVNTSYSASFAAMLQVNPVPSGTVAQVQAKIHKDADWIPLWTSNDSSPHYLEVWSMPYNFMRVVRLSGTGVVKAYQAMFTPDHMS